MKCDQQKSVPNFLCLKLYDLGANKPSPRDIILLVEEEKNICGNELIGKGCHEVVEDVKRKTPQKSTTTKSLTFPWIEILYV